MPPIKNWLKIFCLTTICVSMIACGKANDKAPAVDSSGKHPENWLTGHRAAYQQNRDQCRECHGTDLMGGVTKIGCSTDSCHANGHSPRNIAHVLPFAAPTLHGSEAKKDLTICQDCHGTAGGAGSTPRFNITYGSLPAGCESSGCHSINMAHPKPWRSHGTAGNLANACALCHGVLFEGSTTISAPACKKCHTQLVAGLVPTAGQCVSCHGNPPNGSVTPNRAGSHAVHLALAGMSGNCSSCHNGGGSGATNHTATLTLAFTAGYSSNFGTATYTSSGATCSNISCHGGQVTPPWYGGNLDVTVSCTGCHKSGTTEVTSYHSGEHAKHLGKGLICTDCHDMTNAAAPHFGNVTTKAFETLPNTTLRSYLRYNKTAQSCSVSNPPPQGVQFTGCHSGTENWQ